MMFKKDLIKKKTSISLNLVWFILLLSSPRHIYEEKQLEAYILWNTGYSNYLTVISANRCRHLEPGGTLVFPKIINKLCAGKQNTWSSSELDRFHTSYKYNLEKIGAYRVKLNLSNDKKGYNYFIQKNILITGHLNKLGIQSLFHNKNKRLFKNYLVLPNHGQPKHLNKDIVQVISKFRMRIAGSQSRKYQHHIKTQKKFQNLNIPVIYKPVWGHLIFMQ